MQEDDFEDFGGFEAAEPAGAAVEAQPVAPEASANPWAFYAVAAAQPGRSMQPDLLPGDMATEPPAEPTVSNAEEPIAIAMPMNVATPRSISEQVLEPQFGSHGNIRRPDKPVPAGVLDLDLSHMSESERGQGDADDLELDLPDLQQPPRPAEPSDASNGHQAAAPVVAEDGAAGIDVNVVEQEKIRQELDELVDQNMELAARLETCREQLTEQKLRFSALQDSQNAQLNDMQAAGHDALVLVVEQYKELSKVTVLEQQQLAASELKYSVEREAERCSSLMQQHSDSLKEMLEKERQSMNERIQEALEKQRQEQQVLFRKAIEEEQETCQAAIKKAVEDEREEHRNQLDEALKVEREKSRQFVEEQQVKLQKLIQEEREACAKAIENTLAEEKDKCQSCISASLAEEREKRDGAVKEAMTAAREEMKQYVKEQRQADGIVRRRALASIDLFLETAQSQVKLLLEHSLPDSDNNL